MQLSTIVILVFIARSCLAGSIIETLKQDESSHLVQATVEVLKSCYGIQVSAVGIAGNSDRLLIKTLQSSIHIPVILVDSSKRLESHDPVQRKRPWKLQVYVITASSTTELEKTLRVIKDSIWWNHMASILILGRPPVTVDGCSEAFEMLWAAWKMNLLNTKLICLHRTKEILMYTYNPYMRMAPDRWEVEKTYRGENDHPWTLFVRKYREDKEICEDLEFDKTKDLGGYEIRSSVKTFPGSITVDFNKNGTYCLQDRHGLRSPDVFSALNGILKFLIYNSSIIGRGLMDINGRDILMDPVDGISDILLNMRSAGGNENITTLYPFHYSGLWVFTQYNSQMSQLTKILSVVDSSSRGGICFVILITLLFFIFFLRQSLVPAMLNTLRIICNGSLPIVPTNLAPRFYLGSLFIFVVTIQALYQGKLAALLTNPVFLPNVNTMQDLIDGNYTIYSYKTMGRFFRPPAFKGRFVGLNNFSCTEHVLRDSSAACIVVHDALNNDLTTLKLYLSNDAIIKVPTTYVIREDWPLEPSVNKILARMFEANIIWDHVINWNKKILNILYSYQNQKEQRIKSINLEELSFAFVILGIGLGCATICFIVETGIKPVRSWISTIRSYF